MVEATPQPSEPPSAGQIAAALQPFDTCMVANAIETFGVRLRNEGYIQRGIRCLAPHLPSSVGYAFTLRVRASSPPPLGPNNYVDRTDWWEELERIPRPRILVIEDVDRQPGSGAFIGAVHAEILHSLGCVAAVTNGAVRDLPQAAQLGFQLFAGGLSVSHAYVHIIASGGPVTVEGLEIRPGDLLHGDVHGVLRVPLEIAGEVPAVASRMEREEKDILHYCRSEQFSISGLREVLRRNAPKI